jgi:hypothetical protein
MNAPATVPSHTVSPGAAQMNEALKNVAAMNNKVGGKRKTRRRKQTRKNKKARKGTRRGGGRKGNSAACEMILKEQHAFPSLLIRIANRTQKMPGPNQPTKFYDCEKIMDDGEVAYTGRSCDNPEFDNMIIKKDKVLSVGYAHNVDDLVSWCCHTSG